MITAVFEGLNPVCIGDATTGRLVGFIVSAGTLDLANLFETFQYEFNFPSPVEPERDEHGPIGAGEVTEAHVRATVKAKQRAAEFLESRDRSVSELFMLWLHKGARGIVIELHPRTYVTPCYFSAMPVELDCGDEK